MHLNCLDSDITQQEYVHKTLLIEPDCQGKGFEICLVDSLFPGAIPFFHLSVFIQKKRNQVIICLNKDCARCLHLCEFHAVWISRSLKRGWAEVITVPWLPGVLCCRIWKPEGIKEVPKNGITNLWMSVDAFIPPSVWGLSFSGHFYFTEYPP